MNKKFIIVPAIAGLGLAGGLFATSVYAQDIIEIDSKYPSIVGKLAETFNLDEAAVQDVFEADREEREDERLDQLVTDGELTQEQRDLLEAKQDEHQSAMKEIMNSDMTEDEKREAMDDLRLEMENWMDENDINTHFGMGMHLKGGPKGGFGFEVHRFQGE